MNTKREIRRTRKPRRCTLCGGPIAAGMRYLHTLFRQGKRIEHCSEHVDARECAKHWHGVA